MTTEEITAIVNDVLFKVLAVPADKITAEAELLEDLGADSLDFAEISAALADRGVSVDKTDMKELVTVADLIALATKPADG
jgi:acyl carrier protein